MKNFKDYAVTVPGRYAAALDIPNLSTVSQLIAWLNDNPTMILTSSPGAILQAGTKNNAENLNESQKDALMSTWASSTVDGLIERYTHGVAELNGMFENPSCGAFNARMLFTPTNTNALVAPVLTVGGEDYTICIKGAPVAIGYLVAGSSYLLAIDVDTKKANLVQLEITDSAIVTTINDRLDEIEAAGANNYTKVIANTTFARGQTLTVPITLEPQYIRMITTIQNSGANLDVALDTPLIGLTDNLTSFREYIIEIFSDGGTFKWRRIKDVDTADHPFDVTVTSDSHLTIYSNHPDHNHILILSQKMI